MHSGATRIKMQDNLILTNAHKILKQGILVHNYFFNHLKPKLVYINFKNSVRTSKRTQHFAITTISLLTLFKGIISIYEENDMKSTSTKYSITDW
jgi:hypothetical protein